MSNDASRYGFSAKMAIVIVAQAEGNGSKFGLASRLFSVLFADYISNLTRAYKSTPSVAIS